MIHGFQAADLVMVVWAMVWEWEWVTEWVMVDIMIRSTLISILRSVLGVPGTTRGTVPGTAECTGWVMAAGMVTIFTETVGIITTPGKMNAITMDHATPRAPMESAVNVPPEW